jgi:RNA polymerase sigma factor (sigma-70 family)
MDRWPQMLKMENLEGYALTILKRRIADIHRKRRCRPELMETAAFEAALTDTSEDPYDTLTEALALHAAVAALSERQRDAIVLYYGLGFTTAGAADLMGNEEATVRSQLRTDRQRGHCRRVARRHRWAVSPGVGALQQHDRDPDA